MKSRVGILLGLVLALSLVLGSTAHALIPHEHGDHHQAGESVMWQALHAALRHDDKQLPLIPGVLAVVAVAIVARARPMYTETAHIVDSLFEHLRRGVAPHRRFG